MQIKNYSNLYTNLQKHPVKCILLFLYRIFHSSNKLYYIYNHKKFYFSRKIKTTEKTETLCICSRIMEFDFISSCSLMTTFLCIHKETSVSRFIKSRHIKTVFKYLQFQYLSDIKAKNKRASKKKNERVMYCRSFFISHFFKGKHLIVL